jgi:RHS repeat-associated protein
LARFWLHSTTRSDASLFSPVPGSIACKDSYLDTYSMGAREYDPSLGRWLSADTIVPDPANPQSLNRYSYVYNNPLKFIDPSGHGGYPSGCEHSQQCMDWWDATNYYPDIRRQRLAAYAYKLHGMVQEETLTGLGAFAALCDYEASLLPKDIYNRTSIYVYDLRSVLVRGGEYYDSSRNFGQSGFAVGFQDPGAGGEQPEHFWAYVHITYKSGKWTFRKAGTSIGVVGNYLHETVLTNRWIGPSPGRSYQDLALGAEGVELGDQLSSGGLLPENVGDYARTTLGPGSPALNDWYGPSDLATHRRLGYALDLTAAAMTFWPIPAGDQGGPAYFLWPRP